MSGKRVISLISCHNVLFRGRYPTFVLSPNRSKGNRTVFKTGLQIRHNEKKSQEQNPLKTQGKNSITVQKISRIPTNLQRKERN